VKPHRFEVIERPRRATSKARWASRFWLVFLGTLDTGRAVRLACRSGAEINVAREWIYTGARRNGLAARTQRRGFYLIAWAERRARGAP